MFKIPNPFNSNINNNNSVVSKTVVLTPTTTTTTDDRLYTTLMLINRAAAYYCVFAHVLFILLVCLLPELRKRTLLFINHAVVTSLFYPLAMFTLQQVNIPNLDDRTLAHRLCSLFEIFWPFGIYIRMYSIVLIAVHRYTAVFHIELFKRINDSRVCLAVSILAAWSLSILLPLTGKHLFNTTYSHVFCLDGYSSNRLNSLFYSLFFVIFSLVLPAISIVTIYASINARLRRIGNRLCGENMRLRNNNINNNKSLSSSTTNSLTTSTMLTTTTTKRPKVIVTTKRSVLFLKPAVRASEIRFANQYVLMCLIVILTICFISVFSLKGVLPDFFRIFFYWRPVIRTCILLLASMIPTLSFYFSPAKKKLVKLCVNKFRALSAVYG